MFLFVVDDRWHCKEKPTSNALKAHTKLHVRNGTNNTQTDGKASRDDEKQN